MLDACIIYAWESFMAAFDLIIKGGTVVTATDNTNCDVGVRDGKVAALGRDLGEADREIDASGKLLLPGGIDSHCHIEQVSGMGVMCADDFYTGSVSAAFGGTTTIIPFACQHRGDKLCEVVQDYHDRAGPKRFLDEAEFLPLPGPGA